MKRRERYFSTEQDLLLFDLFEMALHNKIYQFLSKSFKFKFKLWRKQTNFSNVQLVLPQELLQVLNRNTLCCFLEASNCNFVWVEKQLKPGLVTE